MNRLAMIAAALIVASAIVYNAGTGRYQVVVLEEYDSAMVVDTRTGESYVCVPNEFGPRCMMPSTRKKTIEAFDWMMNEREEKERE